jgi:hypothetical protein
MVDLSNDFLGLLVGSSRTPAALRSRDPDPTSLSAHPANDLLSRSMKL